MLERTIRFGNIRIEEYTEHGIKVKVLRKDRLRQGVREMYALSWIEDMPVYSVFDMPHKATWTVTCDSTKTLSQFMERFDTAQIMEYSSRKKKKS